MESNNRWNAFAHNESLKLLSTISLSTMVTYPFLIIVKRKNKRRDAQMRKGVKTCVRKKVKRRIHVTVWTRPSALKTVEVEEIKSKRRLAFVKWVGA